MTIIYFDKVTNDGVQVVQVGKSQMWDWCAWSKHGYQGTINCEHPIFCNADSLRKGSYVVLEMSYMFGCIQKRLHVVASFSSLRRAVEAVGDYKDFNNKHEYTHWKTDYKLMYEYEVWHIVDDAELWESWEYEAHMHLQPDCVLLEVGECEESTSCWTCACNKLSAYYRPETNHDGVVCTYCGDDSYGPWIRYYVPSTGYCYVCENCEVQAKLDGGHYVKLKRDTLTACYNADVPF